MNTLNILLSYDYIANLVSLNWYDIMVAIEGGFLPTEAAIEHAITELEKVENPEQAVVGLACLEKGDSIHPHIDDLSAKISEQSKKEAYRKILYVLLNWVYEQKSFYTDPLEVVEIIYADFDYPEIISNFVRYMPSEQPSLGTLEENTRRLYDNWKKFLYTQNQKYSA